MNRARIVTEVSDFLANSGFTATELARTAGVNNALISRLKTGKHHDTTSTIADSLRGAMASLLASKASHDVEVSDHAG